MKDWLPMAGVVLDELLRRDGRGDYRNFERCLSCGDRDTARPATIRCTTCDAGPLECEECVRERHQRHACHRLQVSPVLFQLLVLHRQYVLVAMEWKVF